MATKTTKTKQAPKRTTAKKSVQKSGTKKAPAKKSGAKKATTAKKNPFIGASEVSITATKISVVQQSSKSKKGSYSAAEKRTYVDKTPANMAALNEALSKRPARKITVKM